jgi:hypothetical protein
MDAGAACRIFPMDCDTRFLAIRDRQRHAALPRLAHAESDA